MLGKIMYPLLYIILKMIRKHEFKFKNEHPQLKSNAIYAVNHSRKFDIPYVCEALNRHCYVLVGKQRLKPIDKMFFHINGVIWVDRKDRENRHKSSIVMEKMLNKGTNIVMFPEATWNIEPSLPMLPLRWGIIDIARNSHRPIVPVVLEYTDNCCYVSFADQCILRKVMTRNRKSMNSVTQWQRSAGRYGNSFRMSAAKIFAGMNGKKK